MSNDRDGHDHHDGFTIHVFVVSAFRRTSVVSG